MSYLRLLVGCFAAMCTFALGLGVQALASSQRSTHASGSITSLERRVAVLEHRLTLQVKFNNAQVKINRSQASINALSSSRITSIESRPSPSLTTSVQVAFGTTDSNGGATATVFCPGGQKVLGGGAAFVGQAYYADHLLWSHADIAGDSWTASGDGLTGAGRSFETYAVCGDVG